MSGRRCRVLILDWDENALIALQHVLEDGGVDTTITWDEAEAWKLINSKTFDLLLVADHPLELGAESILRDFLSISCPCLLLRAGQWAPSSFADRVSAEYFPNESPSKVLSRCRSTGRQAGAMLALRPSQLPRTHVRRQAAWEPISRLHK
jgi:hypothetical protein